MANYFAFILVFVFVSQVFSAPVVKEDKRLEEELQEIHNVKSYVPRTEILHRTIRQTGQGSGKHNNKAAPKVKSSGKPTAAISQPEASPQPQEKSVNQQQEQNQFNAESNQEVHSTASQDQRLNVNAHSMTNERSAQDLLSQESIQQPRTHYNHPLIEKLKDLKGLKGYGNEYSYAPEYQTISFQEPIYQPVVHQPVLQPVVHQKPVLFHQEVIKPIIHEVVKPLPVYHETVKPIVHEVVKHLPVVQEVIKPVPVVHEILKPYTVPVVHPVQFHHQPTQINVPMQWSCQLVPGAGGPSVSGIQNGYGSYGSHATGYGSYGSYAPAVSGIQNGYTSYGSYSPASYSPALSGGFSQGGLYGLSGGHGASLGTYSLPIKTLPAKIIGGHGHGLYKSNSEGRDSMQDNIEDMIQNEELNYSSMGPSSDMEPSEMTMKSMAQENPQLFAKVMDNMNQKRTNLRNSMRSNIFNFQQTSPEGISLQGPQSLTNEQMQKIKMSMDRRSQQPSLEQLLRNAQFNNLKQMPREQIMRAIPMERFPLNARTDQLSMIQMRGAEIPQSSAEMVQPLSWDQQRSAQWDQQIALEQMRAAQEQQMVMEQMR